MPKDKVEAAIKRAQGKEMESFEEILYECYGPHGVPILIDTATDNPTRTVANIRAILNRTNGNLGSSGSVAFQFQKMGVFRLAPEEHRLVDEGHARQMELAIEVPGSPLEALLSGEAWTEVYDRIAALVLENRTTIVFVNTRRLAERVSRHLAERLGEERVTSHHGSLSRERRLDAERREGVHRRWQVSSGQPSSECPLRKVPVQVGRVRRHRHDQLKLS